MASIDFQLHDDGTATGTLTPEDALAADTVLPVGTSVPVWTSSSPDIVVTASADGMTAKIVPSSPPVLVTGVTVSASATLPNNPDGSPGATITGTSEGIDVVPGGPTGFKIALS